MKVWDNIKLAYTDRVSYPVSIISGLLIGFVLFYFTNFWNIYWNLGKFYAVVQVITQLIISILFGINIALLWQKLKLSSSINATEAGSITLGSVLSIIVSGCPACGITLASYLGVATIFTAWPLYGLELKFLGLGFLMYSTYDLGNDLYRCRIKSK